MNTRIITSALLALSIGFGTTAANAGILGDLAGKVLDRAKGQSTSQPVQHVRSGPGPNLGGVFDFNPDYVACNERVRGAVIPSERERLKDTITKACASKYPVYR